MYIETASPIPFIETLAAGQVTAPRPARAARANAPANADAQLPSSSSPKDAPAPTLRARLVGWLRVHFPHAFAGLAREYPHLLSGLGDTMPAGASAPANAAGSSGASQPWYASLATAAAQFLPLYQQQQLWKMQVSRAAQGLPPINADQIAPPGVPVKVGIDKNIMVLGLAGAALIGGGLYLSTRKKRHG